MILVYSGMQQAGQFGGAGVWGKHIFVFMLAWKLKVMNATTRGWAVVPQVGIVLEDRMNL